MNDLWQPERDPNDVVMRFGRGLSSGLMSGAEAVTALEDTLTVVRCDARTISEDLAFYEAIAGHQPLDPRSELFSPIVRLTARGILLRNNDNDVSPEPPKSIDEVASNSTEGILWESESGRRYRQRITNEISGLLRHFVMGLNEGGITKKQARALVRSEMEEGLDDVATRITSYAAINFLVVSGTILRKAGLASPSARYREIKRVAVNLRRS